MKRRNHEEAPTQKRCPVCSRDFQRRHNEPASKFAKRRYCSKTCAGSKARWEASALSNFRVDADSGCWIYGGYIEPNGYGRYGTGKDHKQAHRMYYEHFNHKIPDGLVVRHECNTRACVNPAHLVAGTQFDNVQDRILAGNQPRGERVNTAKLTTPQARDILRSDLSDLELSSQYGVAVKQIRFIRSGRSWAHLSEEPK